METGWGKSKVVPSVIEMVRNESVSVPERYIQSEENRPVFRSRKAEISYEIPIINLSLIDSGDEDELRKLDFASKEWGFFQVIEHGMKEKVIHNIKTVTTTLFELPWAEKQNYLISEKDIQGYGQSYVVSDHQKLDWNDSMFLVTLPTQYHNMKYWPSSTVPGFKEAVNEYAVEIEAVANKILANFSRLMGLEKKSLQEMHGEMKQGIRMNYYPPCAEPGLVLGVSPHSDCSSISLLLQDDETSGLQIRHKDSWVAVDPIPNAIVVNIGDVLEAWSNGVYKSIEHRVVTNKEKPRISIATFVIVEDNVSIGPVETMFDDCHVQRKYKNVKYVDYVRYALARKMDGKTNTDFLKL